jgi:integrase
MGSPGNWIRNRAEICTGDHHSASQLLTRSASGRARLSYRRAAELFRMRTGWTLHQLRHSALTHAAEDGTNLPLLLARSRHASVRSLERYARPGPEAVAHHLAQTDPARRRP